MDVIINLGVTHFPQIVRHYIVRRLHFALGQFGDRVGGLYIRVLANSISSDGCARCQISAEVLPSGHVRVEEAGSDLYLAIDSAAATATHAFADELQRMRQLGTRAQTIA